MKTQCEKRNAFVLNAKVLMEILARRRRMILLGFSSPASSFLNIYFQMRVGKLMNFYDFSFHFFFFTVHTDSQWVRVKHEIILHLLVLFSHYFYFFCLHNFLFCVFFWNLKMKTQQQMKMSLVWFFFVSVTSRHLTLAVKLF